MLANAFFSQCCSSSPPNRFNAHKRTFLDKEVSCYASGRCKTNKSDPGWMVIVSQKGRKHRFLCANHSNEFSSDIKEPIDIVFS
jgi:hypothetical protein